MQLLTLTSAAQNHFRALIEQESVDGGLNLRIFVSEPGTIRADLSISFCPLGEEESNDLELNYPNFNIFVERDSVEALQEAIIDFKTNELGGELTVKAPYIKGKTPKSDASLNDKVQYLIDTQVNPNLASHGGYVTLVEVTNDNCVVLRFGGGCHGCGLADITLKNTISKTLQEAYPEITQIVDATDHAGGTNPYYVK